ncbi:MAG: ATP-binding cassette domain-containing protein [Gammaproteobacteria bacterium]|nr:ATP-binding cassette domain-containing protein [Gammaproteobacteria bacterium]
MTDPALSLTNVSKCFFANSQTIQALDNISFNIKAGQVTGLIGPDAAGKTTLIRLIAGLLLADEGQINVMGLNVATQPLQVQSSIGYMPQRFGLYEDLTVQENFDLYADLQNVSLKDRKVRFEELTQLTGLSPFTDRLAGKLSGGMKQKLGLACTLIKLPHLLLLDEATVGVDPVSRRELWNIVYQQVQQHNMTVLLATAYLDEAERCDEVVLLHEGKLIKQDQPQQFSQHVKGRVFYITAKDVSVRALQAQLSQADTVLDALVESEAVRVVMETTEKPNAETLLPNYKNVHISVAKPHFEDAFIALLKTKSLHTAKHTSTPILKNPNQNDTVIAVNNLVRRFGNFTAVNNINFSVKRGEIFGLLGANGAGKSTTFRMLCGLLPVSSGHVAIAGKNLRKAAASARARIGYMAQKFSLYSHLSVQQNLQFFSSAYGLRNKQQKQRIAWALHTFELEEYTHNNAGDLPLGFKQRLSFATALMHEPDILFLDEPTSGVDPLARREFWERTNMLAAQGVTILVTTHFMEEANYCDRLVIMASGEILAMGTPLSLRQRVRSETNPDPSMEDAFISLIEQQKQQ